MCVGRGMSVLYGHPAIYNAATGMASLANLVPPFIMNSRLNPWAYGHDMMKFPKKPFHEMIKDIEH